MKIVKGIVLFLMSYLKNFYYLHFINTIYVLIYVNLILKAS
jgi:hypothetical protein